MTTKHPRRCTAQTSLAQLRADSHAQPNPATTPPTTTGANERGSEREGQDAQRGEHRRGAPPKRFGQPAGRRL